VPGDDRVEAVVEVEPRIDGMEPDAVAELAQPLERSLALVRGEVVEDRAGHQEVRRPRARLGLELAHAQCSVEREVDVVAEDQVAVLPRALEEGEPVPTFFRGLEQLGVVREIEGATHSTTTSSSRAASSARCSASTDVSAVAIT
jgi:hypothetical protein